MSENTGILESKILEAMQKVADETGKKQDYAYTAALTDELMAIFDKNLPETVILSFENFPKNKTVADLLEVLLKKKGKYAW